MNKKFSAIIIAATILLIGLLISISIIRSGPQSSEQATVAEVVIPTTSPNNQTFSNSSSSIKSNDEIQLNSSDTSAVDSTVKKLPIDSAELKVEYSELLDTFYIQNNATDEAQLNQFLAENNLANLYESHPKFFKFTNQKPKYAMDEDEFTFVGENGIGETIPDDRKETPHEARLAPLKNLLNSLVAFDFPTPSVAPGGAVAPGSASPLVTTVPNQSSPTASGNFSATNCSTVVGNERIVCSALKYTGIRYGFANNPAGNKKSVDTWGVNSQSTNGHSPAQWIAKRIPGGVNDFLECSGYVAVAIYDAFGVVEDRCSTAYYGAKNFKKIDISTARPGDLLIKGTGCATSGGGGHIGIFVKRNADGSIQTLESTPRAPGKTGYYNVSPTYFNRAVRYTGPGSTP